MFIFPVGSQFRAPREQIGLTQSELAVLAKTSQSIISRLETGKGRVTRKIKLRVYEALLDRGVCWSDQRIFIGISPDLIRLRKEYKDLRMKASELRERIPGGNRWDDLPYRALMTKSLQDRNFRIIDGTSAPTP